VDLVGRGVVVEVEDCFEDEAALLGEGHAVLATQALEVVEALLAVQVAHEGVPPPSND